MIPAMNIVAWSQKAPWPEDRQVEQDLIISRALVEIFKDDYLKKELRFRGGTALNKLHFPSAYRYSEDIDLTRTTEGPVGPILDHLRAVLEPWMGRAHYDLCRAANRMEVERRP
ncbi:transposase [Bradyrhizobium elkanii USDA 61]|nr:transposase [Bradyrhizobium elkanii USDA 61]